MPNTMNNDEALNKNVLYERDFIRSTRVNPRMAFCVAGASASNDRFKIGAQFSRWVVTLNATGKPGGEIPVAWALARAFLKHPSPKREQGIFCPHPPGEPGGVNPRMLWLTINDHRLKTRRSKSPEIES